MEQSTQLNRENQLAINDILSVMGDRKMYINEKKLYINSIDLLHKLGYYKKEVNNNSEKVSLYWRFR